MADLTMSNSNVTDRGRGSGNFDTVGFSEMAKEGEDPVIEQPNHDHDIDDDRRSQNSLDHSVHKMASSPLAGLKRNTSDRSNAKTLTIAIDAKATALPVITSVR
jgi:hypothetical protein